MSVEIGLKGVTQRILGEKLSRRKLLKMVPHASILLLATVVAIEEARSYAKAGAEPRSSVPQTSEIAPLGPGPEREFLRAIANSVERISSFNKEELIEEARPWAQEHPQTFSEVIGGFFQAQEEPKGARQASWQNLVLLNFILAREKMATEEWKSLAPEHQEKYWEHVQIMNLILTKLHPNKDNFLKMTNLELGGLLLEIFEDTKKIQEKYGFPPQKPESHFPLVVQEA